MTLLEIEILMHYACRADDYRHGDFSAPAVRDAIDRFTKQDDLLNPWPMAAHMNTRYCLTERGKVFVQALQDLPLPVSKWVMPGGPA